MSTSLATTTAVVPSATSVLAIAANAFRKGLVIDASLNTTDTVWVRFSDSAVSSALFTYQINAGDRWELPIDIVPYMGAVQIIWSTAGGGAGNVMVTEIT